MGYDRQYFLETVNEVLICAICNKVLENPLEVAKCEHYFCQGCIEGCAHCPVDGNPVRLGPVPRLLKKMLSKLIMRCRNAHQGCGVVLPLDLMQAHLMDCENNSQNPLQCVVCEGLLDTANTAELEARLATLDARVEAVKQQFDQTVELIKAKSQQSLGQDGQQT